MVVQGNQMIFLDSVKSYKNYYTWQRVHKQDNRQWIDRISPLTVTESLKIENEYKTN